MPTACPCSGPSRSNAPRTAGSPLTATDLDAFATVRLEQPAEGEPLALLVPYEELAQTVKTCGKDENILVAPGAKRHRLHPIRTRQQFAETKVESLPVEEFPETPRFKGDAIPLPDTVRTSIHEALQCASTDETRLILNGAYLDVSKPEAHYVVGTDGRHLFSSNSFSLPLKNSLIIPEPQVPWVEGIQRRDGEWQLRIGTAGEGSGRRQLPRSPAGAGGSSAVRSKGTIRTGARSSRVRAVSPRPSSSIRRPSKRVLQTIGRMPCDDAVNGAIGMAVSERQIPCSSADRPAPTTGRASM